MFRDFLEVREEKGDSKVEDRKGRKEFQERKRCLSKSKPCLTHADHIVLLWIVFVTSHIDTMRLRSFVFERSRAIVVELFSFLKLGAGITTSNAIRGSS